MAGSETNPAVLSVSAAQVQHRAVVSDRSVVPLIEEKEASDRTVVNIEAVDNAQLVNSLIEAEDGTEVPQYDDESIDELYIMSSAITSDMYSIDINPTAMSSVMEYISAGDVLKYDRISKDLSRFRELVSIDNIKSIINNKRPSYSCAVLAFGGLVCTIASIISGFIPIWGTETCSEKQRLWQLLLPEASVYPDTFKDIPKDARKVIYMTSGFPCPDYSPRGSNLGSKGSTGWMYVKQVEVILEQLPVAIRLEQSDNALSINNKQEVEDIILCLSQKYTLHYNTIETWRYGDVTNRKRFIIVGFLTEVVGEYAKEFSFPSGMYDENHAPCALHVAENSRIWNWQGF